MGKTKKSLELFKELPPSICQIATEETHKQTGSLAHDLTEETLRMALSTSFMWMESQIGYEFWDAVCRAVSNNDGERLDKLEHQAWLYLELSNKIGPENVALAKQLLAEMEDEDESY